MNNVLVFPKKYKNRETGVPQNRDEVYSNILKNKQAAIEVAVDHGMTALISSLNMAGYSVQNDYDIGLAIEVVRSMVMRQSGLEHPLQQMADTSVYIIDEEGRKIKSDGTVFEGNTYVE